MKKEFKVGDVVKITGNPVGDTKPQYIGKKSVIESITFDGSILLVPEYGNPHTYPPESLELIARDEPKSAESETVIIKAWEVYSSDGRSTSSIALFKNEEDANTVAGNKLCFGVNGPIEIIVYGSFKDYETDYLKKVRKVALSKLSDEEKQALGLV